MLMTEEELRHLCKINKLDEEKVISEFRLNSQKYKEDIEVIWSLKDMKKKTNNKNNKQTVQQSKSKNKKSR